MTWAPARCEWEVGLTWARRYPEWPVSLRCWLANVRALGLTQITVLPDRYTVHLVATRPGDPEPTEVEEV
jgi:hypothetical protein